MTSSPDQPPSAPRETVPVETAHVETAPRPPRAFTQGVGTVFQFAGVTLFLCFFTFCCFSALLSKETAMHSSLGSIGWAGYTAQRAISISMVVGVVWGMSLAGIGLGLQAQRRFAPTMASLLSVFITAFWLFHSIFYALAMNSIGMTLVGLLLTVVSAVLMALSIASFREMRRNPPAENFEILPADYKVPYSHLHQDPPEIRLARELEHRRERLVVQQKELEMLEQKLHRKLKEKRE